LGIATTCLGLTLASANDAVPSSPHPTGFRFEGEHLSGPQCFRSRYPSPASRRNRCPSPFSPREHPTRRVGELRWSSERPSQGWFGLVPKRRRSVQRRGRRGRSAVAWWARRHWRGRDGATRRSSGPSSRREGGPGWPTLDREAKPAAQRPRRCTRAAAVTKATIRMSAPQFGQTSGRDSNSRASSMAQR
jgi:hypothetical protein